MIIVAEGAIDCEGNPIKSESVRKAIGDQLQVEARVSLLGHIQRGGTTSFFDRYLVFFLPIFSQFVGHTAIVLCD